jgi:sulfotransferase family protein
MVEPSPLRAEDVVVGCVTENTPKFLGQALRLVQSIRWLGGELAQSRVVVGAVEQIDRRARRALESLGAEVRIVARFHGRNPPANRLQIFDELRGGSERHLLILDCDTIVVRDPLPSLLREVFQAKITPFPTVTHEVFERLFRHFGLPLPAKTFVTGYSGTPTIPYFNAGVLSIPQALAERLAPEWKRYNARLADDPALAAPCEKHIHQAALALALAATGMPVREAGAELNYQVNATEFPAPRGYAEIDPVIIHYHDRVNSEGLLLPVPFPKAQERIDAFHGKLAEERSRGVGIRGAGSTELGAGSNGAVLPAPSSQLPAPSSPLPAPIAVLGMHRSGTSIVAQILNAMGCYAGRSDELAPPDVFNPSGYWEHREVVALDDEILAALGANWLEPANADVSKLTDDVRRGFVDRARSIAARLGEHGTWMVKDPRMSLVMPIWREALGRPVCVLVWREPLAVARSLLRRDGLPIVIGMALWEEYTRAMLAGTAALPRILFSYEELMAEPAQSTARLQRELEAAGIDLLSPSERELRMLIDPSLDHNAGDEEGLLNAHQSALRVALRSGSLDVPPIQQATRDLLTAFWQHGREDAPLRKRSRELELLLDSIFASRSWRIGFAVTRFWRKLRPSGEPTAAEKWRKLR